MWIISCHCFRLCSVVQCIDYLDISSVCGKIILHGFWLHCLNAAKNVLYSEIYISKTPISWKHWFPCLLSRVHLAFRIVHIFDSLICSTTKNCPMMLYLSRDFKITNASVISWVSTSCTWWLNSCNFIILYYDILHCILFLR